MDRGESFDGALGFAPRASTPQANRNELPAKARQVLACHAQAPGDVVFQLETPAAVRWAATADDPAKGRRVRRGPVSGAEVPGEPLVEQVVVVGQLADLDGSAL